MVLVTNSRQKLNRNSWYSAVVAITFLFSCLIRDTCRSDLGRLYSGADSKAAKEATLESGNTGVGRRSVVVKVGVPAVTVLELALGLL